MKMIILTVLLCWLGLGYSDQILTLEEAVARTLNLSPKLRIAQSEVDEKAGLQVQSGLLPNPAFAYSVENVFGNKDWQGWESAESRYEVGQLIELGGKRNFRYQTARFEYFAAQAGYNAQQLLLLNRLIKAYILVSASQENLILAQEQAKIADEVYKSVSSKVEAGKVSLIQKNKAEIALSMAQNSVEKAQADLNIAIERLTTFWGEGCPDFESVCYPFYETYLPDPFEKCLADLSEHPELVQSDMEHFASHQNLNLEKAAAIPDVTVTVGYKTLQDTGNKGLILGASIPIPIFNFNQGNIQRARAKTDKAYDQYVELEIALENKLLVSYEELVRAYNETERMRNTILKSAIQSFELAKEGYHEGKFEYLDMLDSQKTLYEVREKFIQALLNYHFSLIDIKYLHSN